MLLTTFYKENSSTMRAEVHQSSTGYSIQFYGPNGVLIKEQSYADKSIHYVQEAAENWLSGVKNLNG